MRYQYKIKVRYYEKGKIKEIVRIVEASTIGGARAAATRHLSEKLLNKGVAVVISPLRH